MSRNLICGLGALSLVLASCAPGPVPMPEGGDALAAFCAAATLQSDKAQKYPEAAIQYLLLASLKDGHIDEDHYIALSKQVTDYRVRIGTLGEGSKPGACTEKFPETDPKKDFRLPADPKEKMYVCKAMEDALAVSLGHADAPRFSMDTKIGLDKAFAKIGHYYFEDEPPKSLTGPASKLTEQVVRIGNSWRVIESCRLAFPSPF